MLRRKHARWLSPLQNPTFLPGASLCKSVPGSETKNKMSSTERQDRGALMEKKPRAMLIDYSQNASPRSTNEVRAWDSSPEQHMETSEKLTQPFPAPTDLPAWWAYLKQFCKALQPGSLLKTTFPSYISSPLNQAQTPNPGHLQYVYNGICPTFLSNSITWDGEERAAHWGRHMRDTGKRSKI